MAAAAPSPKVKEKERTNFYKVISAIYALKRGLCTFIQNEVDLLHTYLKQTIHEDQTTPLQPCTTCNYSFVCWNEDTEDWDLHVRGQCKSKCDVWFHELLECHANKKSSEICWENCDIPKWPFKPWECAKVFMPKGQTPSSAGPADCTPNALLLLLRNCKRFHRKLSPNGHGLLLKICGTVETVMNRNEQLPDRDTETFMQQIIQLLEDPFSLKNREECQAEVANIHKVSRGHFLLPYPDVLTMWQEERNLTAGNPPELIYERNNANNDCGANQLTGAVNGKNLFPRNSKQSQDLSGCKANIDGDDLLPTAKKINLSIPYNPRCGQIIKWTVEDMEKCIGEEIGKGAFGIVYRAIIRPEDSKMLDGNKREFAIKKIVIKEEEYQTSYEKEICYGRILHPFINPIIARAESLPDQSKLRDYVIFARVARKGTTEKTPSSKLCVEVREFITMTLSNVIGYLGQSLQFELSIRCPQYDGYSVDSLIPVVDLQGNVDIPCHFHDSSHMIMSQDVLKFWFQDEEHSNDGSSTGPMPSPPTSDTDRFMCIAYVLNDVGTKILRKLFHHMVSHSYTLDQYLANNRSTIISLLKKKVLNPSQMDILFPPNGDDTNLDDYDITLLSVLFNNIVPTLHQQEKNLIKSLRDDRNRLFGHTKSCKINATDFQTFWSNISSTLITLSQQCGDPNFENEILKEIQLTRVPGASYLSVLQAWFSRLERIEHILESCETSPTSET